ncbi:MAG: DUF393 domain-containing protein [Bacteroidales bacterium]|nr:DUF393 domain-containing protein [Bacteroidales bacterium]
MNIILFDGICNLCNYFVQFIIRRDTRGFFKFAPIQSEMGKNLLSHFNIQFEEVDSVVYIRNDKCFIRSDAVLYALKDLKGFWMTFFTLIAIPRFLRNLIYNAIAKSRYRLFGKKESCMMPSEEIKHRFLA